MVGEWQSTIVEYTTEQTLSYNCREFCGSGHSAMDTTIQVISQQDVSQETTTVANSTDTVTVTETTTSNQTETTTEISETTIINSTTETDEVTTTVVEQLTFTGLISLLPLSVIVTWVMRSRQN